MNFNILATKLENFKKINGFPSSTLYDTEVDSFLRTEMFSFWGAYFSILFFNSSLHLIHFVLVYEFSIKDSYNCSLLNESLPIASQEAQTGGTDFVIEDHQL